MKITARQLRTLQTLFGLYARRSLTLASGEERTSRLAWASQQVGREVASFNELRSNEAARLIDALKQAVGQEVSPPVRKRLDRDAAKARGAHGRKGRKARVEMMATPDALEEVGRLRVRAGMTRENFESWLGCSRSSPLCGRAEPKLLTISDCNRVRWALQAMLRRAESHAVKVLHEEAGTGTVGAAPLPLIPQGGVSPHESSSQGIEISAGDASAQRRCGGTGGPA